MTTPTARFQTPDMLERDLDSELTLDVWESGAVITDASTTGTVTVTDQGGTVRDGPAAFVSTTGRPVYTITAAVLSGLDYDDGWTIEWDVTLVTGEEYKFRNEAALVRRKLYPVVTDQDLYRRASSLDPAGANPITSVTDYQDYIEEAWVTIQLRLWSAGNRPNLILSPSALRDTHLFLTLELVFRDLATRLNEAYLDHSDRYHDMYEASWSALKFRYDTGAEDGTSTDDSRKSAKSTVWLCGRR